MNLHIRIHVFPGGQAPAYMSEGAAGADAYARLDEPVVIYPEKRALVPLGFAVEIPVGYEMQVRPRSGLAHRFGLSLANAIGTVDSDYRGQVHANLINHGAEPFTVKPGDRIAQVVVCPVYRAHWVPVVSQVDLEPTARGVGGHGSTGL